MANDKNDMNGAAELRIKAEEKVDSQPPVAEVVSAELDARRLLHELQVHQVELEMQNEELLSQKGVGYCSAPERHGRKKNLCLNPIPYPRPNSVLRSPIPSLF